MTRTSHQGRGYRQRRKKLKQRKLRRQLKRAKHRK
jgi:hypothetical protein